MKSAYVQAFLEVLKAGMALDPALTGLRNTLERKNHKKLFVPVLLEVVRVLEADKDSAQAVVAVSSTTEAKALRTQISETLKALGVAKTTRVREVIDETLIGGYVATFNHQEYDQSYKKALTNLYESITK